MTGLLGVAGWHKVLTAQPVLSHRFAQRHAILLAGAEPHSSSARRIQAEQAAMHHPRRALSILLGTEQRLAPGSGPPWAILQGTESRFVDSLLSAGNLDSVLDGYPDLEQTWVPLHPDRHAKLVGKGGESMVAIRWPKSTLLERGLNLRRVAQLAAAASRSSDLPVQVWDAYTVCGAETANHVWAFSPNLGTTVEDQLRELPQGSPDRIALVGAIAALRRAMLQKDVVWQGFAPRNMFHTGGRLWLIDFEETATPSGSPFRAAECLMWHQIFFADCLSADEKEQVFGAAPRWILPLNKHQQLTADSFESALLSTQTVTWETRLRLLATSAQLEGAHPRLARCSRGEVVFGHELGHFWGDFVQPQIEAGIFRSLSSVAEPAALAAVMEVFEAAMEADILRIMRSRAEGLHDLSTPHTDATAACLTSAGPAAVAAIRHEYHDWYTILDADPAALIAGVVFGLDAGSDIDTTEILTGTRSGEQATRQALQNVVAIGTEFIHRHDHGEPVLHYADAGSLQEMFGRALPDDGCSLDELLGDVRQTVVRHSILQSHPGYLAFPDTANALGAVAGGVLAKLLNQNLIAMDRSAPAATFVEIQTIAWLRELAGYTTMPLHQMRGIKDVGGLWTTGGHLSNHVAMLAALGRRFPQARRRGLRALDTEPTVIMAGPIAHYSHSDAAFHLGLGWNAITAVDASAGYTTDVDAVEKALADPPAGQTPFMVIGVAGNCRTTGLDDLAALAEICRRYRVWFHVDACHGGSLIFNSRLRDQHLAGLEDADSVSLDPHKGLFTPYPSSYVLFRDPLVLTQFSRHEATVMSDDCWDLGLITPFLGSRGFESLSTWMMLRHIGIRRLAALVERRQAIVRYLAQRIDAAGLFIALHDIDFYRLAFVLCPPEAKAIIATFDDAKLSHAAKTVSAFTSELNTTLYRQGEVCFDEHTLADLANRVGTGTSTSYTVMATCPGNPMLTRADLDHAISQLVNAARPIAARLIDHLREHNSPVPTHGHGGPAGWSD